MKLNNVFLKTAIAVAFACTGLAHAAEGARWSEGIGFYVGIDGQAQLTSGTYSGLANPNQGRLTLLFDHGDHFHGIGAYSYEGAAASAKVVNTNVNNRIPETYARTGPDNSALNLTRGTGSWQGKLVSQTAATGVNHEYGHLGVAAIQSLANAGDVAQVLYSSSGGRWKTSADNVLVGLKLESITPGLKISANGVQDIFASGSTYALGDLGNLTFQPVFHVDASTAPGIYSASLSLVNLGSNTSVANGGVFHFDFQVAAVPEPSHWALMATGLAVVGAAATRRKKVSASQPA